VLQVCAANFGEFCSIVGQEATEKLLVRNSLWGIRKACAECFMMVSNSTSPEVRRAKLSPLFISLISDQSRWVRQAAFQSLGRFISTFANPSSTGLHFREDDITGCHTERTVVHTPPNQDGRATPSPEHVPAVESEDMNSFDDNHAETHSVFSNIVTNSSTNNTKSTKETEHTDENFNSFNYWRSPLPDIKVLDCLQPHMDDPDVQGGYTDLEYVF
uniref:Uncharacterized protein n=1 Tax=Mola mola TaxID=94237 RepID=A0A3Q3VRU5_MOLML